MKVNTIDTNLGYCYTIIASKNMAFHHILDLEMNQVREFNFQVARCGNGRTHTIKKKMDR